ncbi:MAG TPA: beta-ketoacyl synthase N-terminal-like domain-containing protein [Alphaproteobacteria bacterium]|nr:beta-ketoacyl synthase N-terminal-like domain-containing protein [Alphaproteobacteria bacterium]
MRRVVVTGMGIVSSIGNSQVEVLGALRESRSGLEFIPEMQELNFRCQVAGRVKGLEPKIAAVGKRTLQNMSNAARYAAIATSEAVEDAKLERQMLQSDKAGVVVGGSFGGINEVTKAEQLLRQYRSPSRLGLTGTVKIMRSTAAGNLAAWLGVQGRAYSICSSSCSGTDNIGHAYELIARGVLDLGICGAAEESCWKQIGAFFDNWRGMPFSWNDRPEKACRPYDRDREGTVFSEGAGILVLEELEHARRRGVVPYAEIVGYGVANDGWHMFEPSGEGLSACLRQALVQAREHGVERIDYVNSHGTGTKLHDALEARVIKEVFGPLAPFVSSTKGLTGHGMGAAGAQEAVFTLLMLRHDFIAPTTNLEHIASDCEGIAHVQQVMERPLASVASFNAGLGGTNACLVFRKL